MLLCVYMHVYIHELDDDDVDSPTDKSNDDVTCIRTLTALLYCIVLHCICIYSIVDVNDVVVVRTMLQEPVKEKDAGDEEKNDSRDHGSTKSMNRDEEYGRSRSSRRAYEDVDDGRRRRRRSRYSRSRSRSRSRDRGRGMFLSFFLFSILQGSASMCPMMFNF